MKTIYFLILVLFSFLQMLAQQENGKNSKTGLNFPIIAKPDIKPVIKSAETKPEVNNPFSNKEELKLDEPFFKPSTDLFTEKKKPSFVISNEKKLDLSQEEKFINPNIDVLDKLNGYPKAASEDFKAISGNQDFGNFKLNSKFVNILCRDFGEADGDQIKVILNGNIIYEIVYLDNFFKALEITLEKGFNKIEFEALNQGTTGPNTAEFQIFDDNKKLVANNQWNLVTGFKASIIVIKE